MAWRSRGHLGDSLEELINHTHSYYLKNNYALMEKIPVPITVTKMNEKGQITLAYFEKASTVDYMGVIQKIPVCFDAKETTKTALPLSNIHDHQVKFLRNFSDQGGIGFMIFHYKKVDRYFFVPLEIIEYYFYKSDITNRKSIPITEELEKYEINLYRNQILNYLPLINLYMAEKKRLSDIFR